MPYRFGDSTLILTVGNTTIGNGLAATDPVTVYSPYGDRTAFGTPSDPTDSFPRDVGDGVSWERIDVDSADAASNWMAGPDSCTPGGANSASTYVDLAVTAVELTDSAATEPGRSGTVRVRTANLGVPDVENCTLSVFLDLNGNGREDNDENVTRFDHWSVKGRQDSVATATFTCPLTKTDLWAWLDCAQDRDSTNDAMRLTIMPGGSERMFDLNLSSFSPDGDGFEESLAVLYRLPEANGTLKVTIFNLGGRQVTTLFSGRPPDQRGVVCWNGLSSSGAQAPTGIYAVCIEYRNRGATRTEKLPVVLLRK
jgi:hypothetical protein